MSEMDCYKTTQSARSWSKKIKKFDVLYLLYYLIPIVYILNKYIYRYTLKYYKCINYL